MAPSRCLLLTAFDFSLFDSEACDWVARRTSRRAFGDRTLASTVPAAVRSDGISTTTGPSQIPRQGTSKADDLGSASSNGCHSGHRRHRFPTQTAAIIDPSYPSPITGNREIVLLDAPACLDRHRRRHSGRTGSPAANDETPLHRLPSRAMVQR